VKTITVQGATAEKVAAYLPDCYSVVSTNDDGSVTICGEDVAGWTLSDYVIPRLATGGMFVNKEDQHG
jgi:hypothetical protein